MAMDALAGYVPIMQSVKHKSSQKRFQLVTAANYYKIYKKGIPEGGVVDRFLEEYFGPVPCGGAWC